MSTGFSKHFGGLCLKFKIPFLCYITNYHESSDPDYIAQDWPKPDVTQLLLSVMFSQQLQVGEKHRWAQLGFLLRVS